MDKPLFAYQLIEIIDNLNLATRNMVAPILNNPHLPCSLKEQAASILHKVHALSEDTANTPNLDRLETGLLEVRRDVLMILKTAEDILQGRYSGI